MIKEITFKNYKAFDEGKIEFYPITILLGANSVGKSSINQLLLMLQQSSLTRNYKSVLKLNGEFISLGENENIFKDKDMAKELILSFKFQDNDLLNSFKNEFLIELTSAIERTLEMFEHINLRNSRKRDFKSLFPENFKKNKWKSKTEFLSVIDKIIELYNQFKKDEKDNTKDKEEISYQQRQLDNYFTPNFLELKEIKRDNYEILYEFLKNCKKLSSSLFEITFHIKNIKTSKEEVFKITKIILSNQSTKIYEIDLVLSSKKNCYENLVIKSELIQSKEFINHEVTKDEILERINFDSTIFYLLSINEPGFIGKSSYRMSNFSRVVFSMLENPLINLRHCFRNEMINYVSPLRAHPKRYYFLDKSNINTVLDSLDGDSLTEILKENKIIKDRVNSWLKEFKLSVDVSTLKDVIHKLKIKQNGLNLDITDVGFGISQVLPVIVQGFLSYRNSLTIVEQPEVHLHPKMQADLADLFIDIVTIQKQRNKSKFLLIETHSEYLIKRLRRRMAENEKIGPQDIAIYYFYPRNEMGTGTIEKKDINSTGFFEYPKDFYSGELLRDNTEFLKHQIKNR
jgi:predicted ATPase